MTGRQAHRMGTIVLSLAMAVIGIALVVQALSGHGGVFSARLLLGVLFLVAGIGRIYLHARLSRARAGDDAPASRRTIGRGGV